MILLALLLAAGDPPRPTSIDVPSDLPLIELQSCITRQMARFGRVTPVPLSDGVALDYAMGNATKAIITMEVRDKGSERRLTISYRHPLSAKSTANFFRDMAKACFPASPPVPR